MWIQLFEVKDLEGERLKMGVDFPRLCDDE